MANILASGASAAMSSDVVLADGASANITLMVASGSTIPPNAEAIIYVATSGANTEVYRLTNKVPAQKVLGPATYRVYRVPGPTFGVDSL